MTVNPLPPHAAHSGPAYGPTRLGRWAVVLAAIVVVVVAVSYTIFGVTYAVGGSIGDNWVGLLGAVALLGGLAVSLVAFVLAVVAKVKHERQALLWLPLSVFPALAAIVLIAEWFWME